MNDTMRDLLLAKIREFVSENEIMFDGLFFTSYITAELLTNGAVAVFDGMVHSAHLETLGKE